MTDNDGDSDTYSIKITIKGGGGIPGFEFAFLIIAIAGIILFKRRNKEN